MDSIIKDIMRIGTYFWVLMGTNYICYFWWRHVCYLARVWVTGWYL